MPSLLFLLDINDLKTVVPTDAGVPMLTGDISLFCSHLGKLIGQDAMQDAVKRIVVWSRHLQMTQNTEKWGVVLFTSHLHDARWQLSIDLIDQPPRFIPLPKLLGTALYHIPYFGTRVASIAA